MDNSLYSYDLSNNKCIGILFQVNPNENINKIVTSNINQDANKINKIITSNINQAENIINNKGLYILVGSNKGNV